MNGYILVSHTSANDVQWWTKIIISLRGFDAKSDSEFIEKYCLVEREFKYLAFTGEGWYSTVNVNSGTKF